MKKYSTQSGTYLIRFSDRNGEHVLTLLYEDGLYNYIIRNKVRTSIYFLSLYFNYEHYQVKIEIISFDCPCFVYLYRLQSTHLIYLVLGWLFIY